MHVQGIYAVLLAAADKVGVTGCWEQLMQEQQQLGLFGFHDLALHPDLVEAATNCSPLGNKQMEGEYIVGLADSQ